MELRIANTAAAMRGVAEWLEQFATAQRLPTSVRHDLNVVLDEVLNNLIAYGYPSGAQDEIAVRLLRDSDGILLEIDDGAVPFDPQNAPKPDLGTQLGARKVGGLGWHIVYNLMDSVSYRRIDNRNLLRMVKKLPTVEP